MSAFKAYDIRGIWKKDFDAKTVYRIGRELPGLLGADKVLVGRDARTSSPEIFEALSRGIVDAGADVHDLGLCTTPTTYYFTGLLDYPAAVMITASHNGPEYNGLKISKRGALPVGADSGLKELERLIQGPERAPAKKRGTISLFERHGDYLDFLKSRLPDLAGLKAVVDCSCGMASVFAPDLFKGADVEMMYRTLDGTFANHSPNPLLPESSKAMRRRVVESGANLGVIFDGDADRVIFSDEQGRFVRPDLITALLANHYLEQEPGASVLCDIRTSRGVTEEIARLGGVPHLWKVGHAFAKIKLREINAIVGGELAGHYYFREFFSCDAAILCAEIVMGVVARAARQGRTFSDLLAGIDIYANTGECNYAIARKAEAMQALADWAESIGTPSRKYDFDGLRFEWPDWWFNVRPSNTEPYLRLIAEADSPERLARKKAQIDAILETFIDK
ncbi:MAG: phosphomannomutase/phosphoglucomutase [Kiritimatiellia bacterium]|jgi:phosphomannomutase